VTGETAETPVGKEEEIYCGYRIDARVGRGYLLLSARDCSSASIGAQKIKNRKK
jgi:hypothetical protein